MLSDALIAVAMSASLTLYVRGVSHIRVARWEAPAFALGWLTIAIALLSPVEALAGALGSAHMTQHELLMVVAAPLVIAGRPVATILWGLPQRMRDGVAALVRRRLLLTLWRRLTGPLTVLVLHAIVLWALEVPSLLQAFTAAMFWWALIHGRYGRIGYGLAVSFVFATMIGKLWSPAYAPASAWIPVAVIFMTIALALFAAWAGESERRTSSP